MPLPDVKGRAEILEYYLKDKPVAPGLDQGLLARQTSGFSGADLSNLVSQQPSGLYSSGSGMPVGCPAGGRRC